MARDQFPTEAVPIQNSAREESCGRARAAASASARRADGDLMVFIFSLQLFLGCGQLPIMYGENDSGMRKVKVKGSYGASWILEDLGSEEMSCLAEPVKLMVAIWAFVVDSKWRSESAQRWWGEM